MIFFLRRHRSRLGRPLLGLFVLALMSATLLPCALAQERSVHVTPVMDHHAMHHSMEMDFAAMHQEELPPSHCPPSSDCPTFKAVDNQAAPKAADATHIFKAVPALFAFFPVPAQPVVRSTFARHLASAPVTAPPLLEYYARRI